MPARNKWTAVGVFLILAGAPAQSPAPGPGADFCSSDAACYTPARGPNCPRVRFGWGDCPGSRKACDWCYGPNGVFAYTPRGSTYTLNSGCNNFGNDATWSTKDPTVSRWMMNAGGSCTADERGGYSCSNVDADRFKAAASCGGSGGSPAPPPASSGSNKQSPCSTGQSCYTPARGPNCPQVRFGWGDCPGSRQACDWCYGPNGVFAYTPRGSTYTLGSGCNALASNATWVAPDAQSASLMANAGGNCASDGRGGYACSNVDPARYQQAANCGGGCWTNLPEGKLCTQGRYFKDRNGRTVILRGVNLAGTSKIPAFLALPKRSQAVGVGIVLRDGVMDTTALDFIGNSDFSELDPLPVWGMNVIRLLFVWEAYEPFKGKTAQNYLDYLARIVDEAWSRGIYTIIDFHQDGYARFLARGCGEGFPKWSIPSSLNLDNPANDSSCSDWMPKAMGLDAGRFVQDVVTKNWNDLFNGQFGVHTAFHDFYADTNGVRSRYRQLMGSLAYMFASHKGVIGYDVLNEPFSDLNESELTSLYADVATDIRQQDQYALLFLEPNLLTDLGKDTAVTPPSGVPGVVYAPHFYDPAVTVLKNYILPKTTSDAYKTMGARAASWKAPLFVGEFGAPFEAGGVSNYIDAIHQLSNDDFVSWAQWSYTPGWRKDDAKDGWNAENLSINDDQLNYRKDLFYPRAYPQAINGDPQSLSVDSGLLSTTLELHWTNNPGGALGSTQTVIYVPRYRYTIYDRIAPTADSGSPPVCSKDGNHRIVCQSSAADARLGVKITRYGIGSVVP